MELVFLITGLMFGGIITFMFLYFYHERVKKNLKKESTKLRELNGRILWYMKDMGLIKWNRDSKGNIVGFDINEKTESIINEETLKNRTIH